MTVKFLAPANDGSVWLCDTLFMPRDWRPLSLGVVWERHFHFVLNRWASSFVVLLIMLISTSFVFMFFSILQQFRRRWFASFRSFWHLSYFTGVFLLACHFKIGIVYSYMIYQWLLLNVHINVKKHVDIFPDRCIWQKYNTFLTFNVCISHFTSKHEDSVCHP